MADAPKLLGTDTLRQAYPKFNQAIDNANEALRNYHTTDQKAEQAITTANSAKTTANSVQEQFNQVVIEGDSSVESAQARVKADGTTFTTLQARLNDTDSNLSGIVTNMTGLVSGEGVDASTSIQSIINFAQSNNVKRIKFPKSTYRLNNILSITGDGIELDFSGSTILNYAKANANQQGETGMFNIVGEMVGQNLVTYYRSLTGTHAPPAEAPVLQTFENYVDWFSETHTIGSRIKTSNNAYFNVGDEILLMGWTRPSGPPYDPTLYEPELRKVVKVVSKDSTYIYTDYYSPFEYQAFVDNTTLKSRAIKVNLVKDVKIKNAIIKDMTTFAVENSPTTTEQQEALSGIFTGLTKNLLLENIRVERHKYASVFSVFARDIQYKDMYSENPQWWVGGKGYLTQVIGSRDIRLSDIFGDGNRHLIDFSWSSNALIDNAHQTNGKSADFDCHGLNEHDIIFNRCIGELNLGNNIEFFPNMCENIKINDSKISLRTNPTNNAPFIKNLIAENSELELVIAPLANSFTFKDCKINWHYNGSRIQANSRGKKFIKKGVFDNCQIKLLNTLLSSSYRITLEEYDEIVFRNSNFEWGFDPLLISSIRSLGLWNNKKVTFDGVSINQLSLEIRNEIIPNSELRLLNMDADYKAQTSASFLNVYSLTSSTLNIVIANSKVYTNDSLYVWTLRTSGMTNSKILANVHNNKLLSDLSGGVRFPVPASNASTLTLHVADDNNIIKNPENVAGFNSTKNIFI